LKIAQETEIYIATSLVLFLINIDELALLARNAFLVSWIDTPVLFVLSSAIGSRFFKLEIKDSIIVSGMTLICGSSAAIALASAVGAPKSNTEIPIAISSFLTIPLIICLPILASVLNFPAAGAGSWYGGSVDSTGAVIATAIVDGKAQAIASSAVVKMMQNILIAPLCIIAGIGLELFEKRNADLEMKLLSDNPNEQTKSVKPGNEKEGNLKLLWTRFPKFIIGFVISSIFYNALIPGNEKESLRAYSFTVAEWFSTFSFVSIGMSLQVSKVVKNLKNAIQTLLFYLFVQILDILITGVLSYYSFAE
jgi:uncharacterized membrane protein YadS